MTRSICTGSFSRIVNSDLTFRDVNLLKKAIHVVKVVLRISNMINWGMLHFMYYIALRHVFSIMEKNEQTWPSDLVSSWSLHFKWKQLSARSLFWQVKGSPPYLNTTPLLFYFLMSALINTSLATTFDIRYWELQSVNIMISDYHEGFLQLQSVW